MALEAPTAELWLYAPDKLVHFIDTPKEALLSLARVLHGGIEKHGPFNPERYTQEHFIDKYVRHMKRASLESGIDESGEPHIIHAAADLLLAWECTKGKHK